MSLVSQSHVRGLGALQIALRIAKPGGRMPVCAKTPLDLIDEGLFSTLRKMHARRLLGKRRGGNRAQCIAWILAYCVTLLAPLNHQ